MKAQDKKSIGLCDNQKIREKTAQFSTNYLFASIASETEFPISNGRGKVLRLPVGNYSYVVKQNLQNFQPPPSNPDQVSRGEIAWGPRKANPIVKTW
jgi:hypothetical protein